MANIKISALTSAAVPLAGTEVLPIVQSGSTVKVSVADLTAGRAVASAGGSFTDNLIQGTAAKGINFTANTPAAGMTSQLLNWYEEGTFTPTDGSGAGLTFSNVTAKYTKVGNQVTVQVKLKYPVTASAVGAAIGGLPFTPSTDCSGVYYSGVSAGSTYYTGGVMYLANSAGGAVTNAALSNQFVIYNMTYTV